MVALKLENFGGMLPAADDRLLPQHFAVLARDTWLFRGNLEGWKTPQLVHQASAGTTKIFRIPNNQQSVQPDYAGSAWMEFTEINTDVVKAPVNNDQFNRFYWASPSTVPMYNTLDRIQSGSPGYTLGIPTPVHQPGIVAPQIIAPATTTTSTTSTSGDGTTTSPAQTTSTASSTSTIDPEVRAYLYTWVSQFGEEGAPSPAFTGSGDPTGNWIINLWSPDASQSANRVLTTMRLYRSVTSSDGTSGFYLVAEMPITQTVYLDGAPDTSLTGNTQLESTGWTPPPTDLQGIIAMPNGMLVGWSGHDLWFCEPYRPHAWPAAYSVSMDFPIVGLGLILDSLLITTTGYPQLASGVHPSSVAISKVLAHEPCVSRGSIVSTTAGVYYASQNGIVLAQPGDISVASEQVIRRRDWASLTDIYNLRSVRYHDAYIGYPSTNTMPGIVFSTQESRLFLAETTQQLNIVNVQEDLWTGEIFLLTSDGSVYLVDPPGDVVVQPYVWRSKEFHFPEPTNLEAMKVYFKLPTVGAPTLGAQVTSPTVLNADMYGFVTVYVDGSNVFSRELRMSGEQWRLPSGFKGEVWQFEVNARVNVKSFQVASSARELAGV